MLCNYSSPVSRWKPQYAKEGFVWDGGTNLAFTTGSYADTVTFEVDTDMGRSRVTVESGSKCVTMPVTATGSNLLFIFDSMPIARLNFTSEELDSVTVCFYDGDIPPFTDADSGHPVLVSPFHREAALCGTCHDVSNPAFEKDGSGNYVPNAFDTTATSFSAHTIAPVERTYSEWTVSAYNTP